MKYTFVQRWRARIYLFLIGVLRHMTVGVRVAVIDGDKVLLLRQTYVPGWHFPGGGVEPGETAEFGGGREMEEETGYRPIGPMPLHGFFLYANEATNRDYIAMYVCRSFEKVREVKPNYEIAELKWFPRDALPADVTEPTRARIEEIYAGTTPGGLW